LKCSVPENIHSSPTEGSGISLGVGGSVRPKNLKKCMKLNRNFPGGRGGGGGKKNNIRRGGGGKILEKKKKGKKKNKKN